MRCAYLEIYNEEIRDLLGADPKKKVDLKQDPEKVCETRLLDSVRPCLLDSSRPS